MNGGLFVMDFVGFDLGFKIFGGEFCFLVMCNVMNEICLVEYC